MNLDNLKPDQVCGVIRKKIREYFGETIENGANVYAHTGYYFVTFKNHVYKGKRRSQLPALFKEWRKEAKG